MVKRFITEKIEKHLSKKQHTIIIGARQTGKTTLLKHLFEQTTANGYAATFISFENHEVLEAVNQHPENIFLFVEKVFEKQQDKKLFLFIDEVQYAANATNFLKYLYDIYEEKIKIIATGSSAFYIDRKFEDSLAGRKRIFHLKHLNFDEYLFAQQADDLQKELTIIRSSSNYISSKRKDILYYFNEYLCFGGYPIVAIEPDRDEKIELLHELRDSYLRKDALEGGILHEQKFLRLMSILAAQTGSLVNRNELATTLGIDNKTIDNYLTIMQKSFHISLITPYSNNLRKELTKMPKIYFSDFGMRNSLLNNFEKFVFRTDKGELLENYINIRLSELYEEEDIHFWRTSDHHEVDFVVRKNYSEAIAFEIKFSESQIKKKKYNTFIESYPEIPLKFMSYDTTDQRVSTNILSL